MDKWQYADTGRTPFSKQWSKRRKWEAWVWAWGQGDFHAKRSIWKWYLEARKPLVMWTQNKSYERRWGHQMPLKGGLGVWLIPFKGGFSMWLIEYNLLLLLLQALLATATLELLNQTSFTRDCPVDLWTYGFSSCWMPFPAPVISSCFYSGFKPSFDHFLRSLETLTLYTESTSIWIYELQLMFFTC